MNNESCQKVFDCISLGLISGFAAFVILFLVWAGMTVHDKIYKPMGVKAEWINK